MLSLTPIKDTDAGINVTIHIACSDESELFDHLDMLKERFKAAFKKNADFAQQEFEQHNCSGSHEAVIIQDID